MLKMLSSTATTAPGNPRGECYHLIDAQHAEFAATTVLSSPRGKQVIDGYPTDVQYAEFCRHIGVFATHKVSI